MTKSGAAVIDGIEYIEDGEFVVDLDTLLDLLESRITVLRTDGGKLGDSINRAFVTHGVSSYAIAESMVSRIIDGDETDEANVIATILN